MVFTTKKIVLCIPPQGLIIKWLGIWVTPRTYVKNRKFWDAGLLIRLFLQSTFALLMTVLVWISGMIRAKWGVYQGMYISSLREWSLILFCVAVLISTSCLVVVQWFMYWCECFVNQLEPTLLACNLKSDNKYHSFDRKKD